MLLLTLINLVFLIILFINFRYKKVLELKYSTIIFTVLSIVFITLLGNTPDLNVYKDFFYNSQIAWKDFSNPYAQVEKGYLLFNVIINFFTSNFRLFLFIYACIFSLLSFGLIKKISYNCCYSNLLFFCYLFPLKGVVQFRNGIALALILIAIYLFLNYDYIKTGLTIFIASLFHNSSLIYYILFLFKKIIKYQYFLVGISLLFIITNIQGELIKQIFDFLPISDVRKTYFLDTVHPVGFSVQYVKFLILFCIILLSERHIEKREDYFGVFKALIISALFIIGVFSFSTGIAHRFSDNFIIGEIFIIPYIHVYLKEGKYKLVFEYFMIVYLIFNIFASLLQFPGGIFYRFF